MLKDLIIKNRSYRRFHQQEKVEISTLEELVDLARLSASAANLQPLKYYISSDEHTNGLIFPHLSWAGYLKDWPGPSEGERPSAYIIILGDKTITNSFGCDHGIACQSILLGATEKGLGGCIIASIQKNDLRNKLNIPEKYDILLAIALGKPKEIVEIEQLGQNGDVKYWRDNQSHHHVPKRQLKELIIKTDI